jgi:hypothetical protein
MKTSLIRTLLVFTVLASPLALQARTSDDSGPAKTRWHKVRVTTARQSAGRIVSEYRPGKYRDSTPAEVKGPRLTDHNFMLGSESAQDDHGTNNGTGTTYGTTGSNAYRAANSDHGSNGVGTIGR